MYRKTKKGQGQLEKVDWKASSISLETNKKKVLTTYFHSIPSGIWNADICFKHLSLIMSSVIFN